IKFVMINETLCRRSRRWLESGLRRNTSCSVPPRLVGSASAVPAVGSAVIIALALSQTVLGQTPSLDASRPIAHWRFDEITGSTRVEDSEGHYPGPIVGAGVSLGTLGISRGALSISASGGGSVRMGD